MKKIILTEAAPAPIGPYSQAVLSGPFLFCSGQIPLDPKSNQIVGETAAEQAEQVIKNIAALLSKADLDFKNVVKSTIFLTNMNDFVSVNEVYSKAFPNNPPARSTVAVVGLPRGVKVEIEVIAAIQ